MAWEKGPTFACDPARAAADVLHDELLLRAAKRDEVARSGRGRAAALGSAAAYVMFVLFACSTRERGVHTEIVYVIYIQNRARPVEQMP